MRALHFLSSFRGAEGEPGTHTRRGFNMRPEVVPLRSEALEFMGSGLALRAPRNDNS